MKKIFFLSSFLLCTTLVNAQRIDIDQLEKATARTPILIDVRTNEEYTQGTIPGAMSLNIHSEDFKRVIEVLPREREIIVFCQSGKRSQEAFEMLTSLGFKNVSQLAGGYEVWREAQEKRKDK